MTSEEEGELTGINVAPLVDIVLVLLIIFMVTANTIVRETVELELPRGSDPAHPRAPVMISMDARSRYFFDGVEVAPAGLLAKLKDAALADREVRAVISADRALHYGRVIALIDLVKEAGIAKFALDTQKDAQPAAKR
jgi:biopolymer transport protein ExbD